MEQDKMILVVSVTIVHEDKVLIIKENKPHADEKWNFPSGRMEYGEDILYSAQREVKEETGLDVKLIATTGVYNFNSRLNNQVILFHFIDSKWIKVNDLIKFEKEELREPAVMKQITENLVKENTHSITLYNATLI